jgi:ATP-dependent DNA helicase DinG
MAALRLAPDGQETTLALDIPRKGSAEAWRRVAAFCRGVSTVFLFHPPEEPPGAGPPWADQLPDARFVDLGFTAEYFLPDLPSHTPRRIWEHLAGKERQRVGFSAPEMVRLGADLVAHTCGTLLNDGLNPRAPALRFFLRGSETLFGDVLVHLARHYRSYFGGLFDPCTLPDTESWYRLLEKAIPVPRKSPDGGAFKPVDREGLAALFQGLAKGGGGYEFRPVQHDYACHVADALNDGAILTIEAGTGTGKTQGYLIPALAFLRRNPQARIVISTYTKQLQEQLLNQELAFVRNAFPGLYDDIPAALLKGKSSYVCVRKLDHLYEPGTTGARLLAWLYLLNIAFRFRTAEADAAGDRVKEWLSPHLQTMRNEVSARSGCPPTHNRCPAQVVTAEAATARLVVTNHHKLALMDNDPVLTGLFRNYVIDEANHFEAAVRNAHTIEVGSRDLMEAVRYLEPALERIRRRAVGKTAGDIAKTRKAMGTFREALDAIHALLETEQQTGGGGAAGELRDDDPNRRGAYQDGLDGVLSPLEQIGKRMKWVRDPDTCRVLKIQERTVQRIRTVLGQLADGGEAVREIRNALGAENRVLSFRMFRRHWALLSQSVEVGPLISHHIYGDKDGIVFTAATLCHRGSFQAFRSIVGLDGSPEPVDPYTGADRYRFRIIPSPFAADRMRIVVPEGAVSGKYGNKARWTDVVSEMIPRLILENGGRTLVLFASYADLEAIVPRVAGQVDGKGYPLLIQQRSMPTLPLCDAFRTIEESVLFGVDTFWYGVDFRGDTLTQVIITRIPYPSPSDPIQAARKQMLPPAAYWNRYRYETEIKLRQGIGRLIRCQTDHGRVVILDSRYRSFVSP